MDAPREPESPADAGDDPADDLKKSAEEDTAAGSAAGELPQEEMSMPADDRYELDWKKLPKPLVPFLEHLIADLCDDRNPSKAIKELCIQAESIGETDPVGTLLSTWFHQDMEVLASAVPVSYLVAELEHGSPVLSRLFIAHWKQTDNPPKLERLADAAGNVRERLKDREAGIILYELAIAVALHKPVRAKRLIDMAAPLLDAEKDASLIRDAREWQQAGEILKKFGPRARDFWKPRLQNPEGEWDWSTTENHNALTQISFEITKGTAGSGLFGRFLKLEADAKAPEESVPVESTPAKVEVEIEEKESPSEAKTKDAGEPVEAVVVAAPPPPEPAKESTTNDENEPSATATKEERPKAETTLSERLDAAAKGRSKTEEPEAPASKKEEVVEKAAEPATPSAPASKIEPAPTPVPRSSGLAITCLFGVAAVALGAYFWPQIQAVIVKPPATFVRQAATAPPVTTTSVPSAPATPPSPVTAPVSSPLPETPAPQNTTAVTVMPAPPSAAAEPPQPAPRAISSPAMDARVNESLEIVKELPAVGRWAQRARGEPFAKVERLVTGRETYLPQLSDDYSSLIKVLLLDPPSDAMTRQVVCKQAVRCIPAVQLVPLFEKLVHQDSVNRSDVKEAAKLLLQLRRESMGPSMSSRLEQLISKAGD